MNLVVGFFRSKRKALPACRVSRTRAARSTRSSGGRGVRRRGEPCIGWPTHATHRDKDQPMRSSTRIRLIEPTDAAPIAAHRGRDFEAFRPWEPDQPADFFTPEGQAERIDRLLAGYRAGAVWPGVVLADVQVIGQVTV